MSLRNKPRRADSLWHPSRAEALAIEHGFQVARRVRERKHATPDDGDIRALTDALRDVAGELHTLNERNRPASAEDFDIVRVEGKL